MGQLEGFAELKHRITVHAYHRMGETGVLAPDARGHGASGSGRCVHERTTVISHSWTFSDKGSLDQARRELGRAWTLGLDGDLTERPGDFVLVVRHQDRAALVYDRWVRSAGLRFPKGSGF